MVSISGFTFGHNLIESGYPIVEAIRAIAPYVNEVAIVDMQSTDGTLDLLARMANEPLFHRVNLKLISGYWGNQAGETLRQAHNLYRQCRGDIIIHFEADEVYEPRLLENIIHLIKQGVQDIAVYRLQLEQNFQRCRWYPEPVHRVFSRNSNTRKEGHTTNRHGQATVLGPENGYLWDITNCFRDNWMSRVNKQAELRNEKPNYLMVGEHCNWDVNISRNDAEHWIALGHHWTWKSTPFAIPEILKPLVGEVKYEPKV